MPKEVTKGACYWGKGHGDHWRSWWSAGEEATKGACYCGEGHGDHLKIKLKLVDWKRGRGLADGYLRASNRQSWLYGLKTGGAEWLVACQSQGERLFWGSAS